MFVIEYCPVCAAPTWYKPGELTCPCPKCAAKDAEIERLRDACALASKVLYRCHDIMTPQQLATVGIIGSAIQNIGAAVIEKKP